MVREEIEERRNQHDNACLLTAFVLYAERSLRTLRNVRTYTGYRTGFVGGARRLQHLGVQVVCSDINKSLALASRAALRDSQDDQKLRRLCIIMLIETIFGRASRCCHSAETKRHYHGVFLGGARNCNAHSVQVLYRAACVNETWALESSAASQTFSSHHGVKPLSVRRTEPTPRGSTS